VEVELDQVAGLGGELVGREGQAALADLNDMCVCCGCEAGLGNACGG